MAAADAGAASGGGSPRVAPTLFFPVDAEAQARHKDIVLATLRSQSEWHQVICDLVPKHKIRVSCVATADGRLLASHLTLHNDPLMIKLGRRHAFPRGFCLVVDPAGAEGLGAAGGGGGGAAAGGARGSRAAAAGSPEASPVSASVSSSAAASASAAEVEDGAADAAGSDAVIGGRLAGQGTFYPKFANDDRNAAFSAKDFGDISKISCFLKYSGSAGIITVIRDASGASVGWTGSSKNSCNHGPGDRPGGTSYAAEVTSIFSEHATEAFLAWCDRWRATSLGLEVMIASDQSHGYGYAASGCIVTAICVEGDSDGRPTYLSPQRLHAACAELGLPTDRPILVEGEERIQSFVESISAVRDLLTLSGLRRLLADRCGVELETMHDRLIDSQIVEGFVIRRWRGETEVDSVKFKIWLYQMVTQVLRPSFAAEKSNSLEFRCGMQSLKDDSGALRDTFLKRVESEIGRWCVASDEATLRRCRQAVCSAAEACLPQGHPQLQWAASSGEEFPVDAPVPEGCLPRSPNRAYWITLGDHAVAGMDGAPAAVAVAA